METDIGSRNPSANQGFGVVCVELFMRMRHGVGAAFFMRSHDGHNSANVLCLSAFRR